MDTHQAANAFLLMPFDDAFDWLHAEIVLAGQSVGARVERADDIFEAGVVIDQIKARIEAADAVIAVCTGRNANVFYELGIAEQWHEPILLAEADTDLPFDIRHYRALFYKQTLESGDKETLRKHMAAAIKQTLVAGRKKPAVAKPAGEQSQQRVIPRVLGQAMMHVEMWGLDREGSYDRIPVDVLELLRQVKTCEDEGRRAPKGELPGGGSMLGRPGYAVQSHAEEAGLMNSNLDPDTGWYLTLTDKGRAFLQAYDRWRAEI